MEKLRKILDLKYKSILHSNATKHNRDYRLFYCAESKKAVLKEYRADFEFFNYSKDLY